jgi:hypothetical protein
MRAVLPTQSVLIWKDLSMIIRVCERSTPIPATRLSLATARLNQLSGRGRALKSSQLIGRATTTMNHSDIGWEPHDHDSSGAASV